METGSSKIEEIMEIINILNNSVTLLVCNLPYNKYNIILFTLLFITILIYLSVSNLHDIHNTYSVLHNYNTNTYVCIIINKKNINRT